MRKVKYIWFVFFLLAITSYGQSEKKKALILLLTPTEEAFDSDYQAILDRATTLGYTLPSSSQQAQQNQLVLDLKSSGIWALLDVLYVFANDGSSGFATINWKSPSTHQVTLVSSPTWTSNIGFNGNGTSSYLNTNWNPATNGVNYTLNSACFFAYVFDDQGVNDLSGSLSGSNGVFIRPKGPSNLTANRINDASNLAVSSTNAIGLHSMVRTGSTARALYKNGSSAGSDSQVSTAIPSLNLFIGAYNNGGTPALFNTRQWSVFGAGSGSINQSSLYTNINTYVSGL